MPPPREDDGPVEDEPADALEALAARLRDTRRLRRAAERDGSYVAAQGLLKLEAELIGQAEAERKARELAARQEQSDEALAAALAEGLQKLPQALRDQVLAAARR